MIAGGLRCVRCGRSRDVTELLAVTEVRQPWRGFYVCRPSITPGLGACFRDAVGPVTIHRIATAALPGGAT